MREWGYLAGIAAIALVIGAGALWLSDLAGMGVTETHDSGSTEQTMPDSHMEPGD